MTRSFVLSLVLAAAVCGGAAAAQMPEAAATVAAAQPTAQDAKMQWWRDAHLGMFIHYGLYSGLECSFEGKDGHGEWTQNNLGLDSERYARAAFPLFRPAADCAEQWAKLAERAGCRYMVLTTKHHEGFALFDAHNSDYTAAKLLGRDLVREFTEACRAHGMRVGFYHSVIDWHEPNYDYTRKSNLPYPRDQKTWLESRRIPRNHAAYIDYLHGQVDDLVSNYGQVDVLWWDYSNGELAGDAGWRAGELLALCRSKQPGIIMNNRLFSFAAEDMRHFSDRADFSTPEKQIPDYNALPEYDWESCMTVGRHWGYSRFEHEYKSPACVIGMLEDCVARGGNLLLNIGPKPDGSVPAEVVNVFERLGDWMQVNGEAVYGSRPVLAAAPVRMTAAQGNRYILLPAEPQQEILIPAAAAGNACGAVVLGQPDNKVQAERTAQGLRLCLPAAAWQHAVEGLPVLKLTAAE